MSERDPRYIPHDPVRGSDVAAWIQRRRDAIGSERRNAAARAAWATLDDLLDDYHQHADTGIPLYLNVPNSHER